MPCPATQNRHHVWDMPEDGQNFLECIACGERRCLHYDVAPGQLVAILAAFRWRAEAHDRKMHYLVFRNRVCTEWLNGLEERTGVLGIMPKEHVKLDAFLQAIEEKVTKRLDAEANKDLLKAA